MLVTLRGQRVNLSLSHNLSKKKMKFRVLQSNFDSKNKSLDKGMNICVSCLLQRLNK